MIQTPKINLIHGDCMDLLRKTPDNHYQLAVIDPPYGIGKALTTWSHTDKALSKVSVDWDIVPDKEYFQELMRVSKNQIIWGGNNFLLPPTNCFLIWEKPNKMHTLADCEYAWTSFSSPAKMTRVNRVTKNKIHITQKPVPLYKWILTNYAKPGDRILDTHGGSMSIAIACYDLGFDLDLTELDKDYYEAGVARFERHKAQGQLFHAPAAQLPEQQKMF